MENMIYITLFIIVLIPILNSLNDQLEDKNVTCGCYTEREDLNSQKECYFKNKKDLKK